MTARVEGQHIPAAGPLTGYRLVASPAGSPLAYLEFALIRLEPGGTPFTWEAGDREAVAYLIGGSCECTVSGAGGALEGVLDSRSWVFDGPPCAVFVPAGSRLGLFSPQDGACLALFSAPPVDARPPRLIRARDVVARNVGTGTWARQVIAVVDRRVASRLLVGETLTPPGHWSSYPPHKHDALRSDEVPMEEIYHYFLDPPGGFALQMVYTAPDDPAPLERVDRVRDGDTVVISRGYHPVVAGGGYRLAYLWAISGERVEEGAWSSDPDHAWLVR
ncbi:MAG: 5-deoxy-glucuronate isomerase [Armatimonadetes bacterium]|nr:5-deoxy-glucuronate isomerase [Armatimonadota bacterium]